MSGIGIKSSILLLILFICLPGKGFSSHIAAGEVTYRCLGDNNYELTIQFFKSCLPESLSSFTDELFLRVYDQDDNYLNDIGNGGLVRLDRLSNDTLELKVDADCIVFGRPFCIHLLTFQGVVNLPFREGGYKLYHNRCCRNSSDNISAANNRTFIFGTTISEYSLINCDSGIRFENWPPLNVCIHTPIEFDHSLSEYEGDYAVYRFCDLMDGRNTQDPPFVTIPWRNPFSLQNLMGGNNPLRIDQFTGLITGIPEVIGSFTIGVCVDEYKNGQIIRSHRREFQLAVAECHEFYADFFTSDNFCNASDLRFENLTQGFTDLEWRIGGIESPLFTSEDEDVIFSFPEAGTYEVGLIAYHIERGCRDTVVKNVTVQDAEIYVHLDKERGPCGDTLILDLSVTIDPDSLDFDYYWEITAGNFIQYFHDPEIEVEIPLVGEIEVFFRGIEQESKCWVTRYEVIETGIIALDGTIDTLVSCDDYVELNSSFYQGNSFLWSPDTFMLDDINTPNPRVSPEFPMTYSVEITNDFCSGIREFYVVILNEDFKLFPDTLCNSRTFKVENNPYFQISDRFQWRFYLEGTLIGSSISTNPRVNFPAYGNASISVIPFRPFIDNCLDTFTQDIFLLREELLVDYFLIDEECNDSLQLIIEADILTNAEIDHNFYVVINQSDTIADESGNFDIWLNNRIENEVRVIAVGDGHSCIEDKVFIFHADTLYFSGYEKIEVCYGDSIQLNNPGGGNFDFKWENTDYFLSEEEDPKPWILPKTSTQYSLFTKVDLCEFFYIFDVVVQPPDSINFEDLVICDSLLTHEVIIPELLVLDSIESVHWIFGPFDDPDYESDEIIPEVQFTGTGELVYSVGINTGIGCGIMGSGNILFSDISRWDINFEIDSSNCVDNAVEIILEGWSDGLRPDEDVSIFWVVNGADTFNYERDFLELTFLDLEKIEIELVVIDELGCSQSGFELFIFDLIQREQFADSLTICPGDTINLLSGADTDLSYIWSPAFGFISPLTEPNPLVSPTQSIEYVAQISSANCLSKQIVNVEVLKGVSLEYISADPQLLIGPGESLLNVYIVGDYSEIEWSPDELLDNPFVSNPVGWVDETTTFTVVVSDAFGCKDSTEITVRVEDVPCAPPFVFLPNAFSPNGDGVNDVLYVRGEGVLNMELWIYNRFGQQVFYSNDQDRGWEGDFRGDNMPPGVYAYHLVVECTNGEVNEISGNITLIR